MPRLYIPWPPNTYVWTTDYILEGQSIYYFANGPVQNPKPYITYICSYIYIWPKAKGNTILNPALTLRTLNYDNYGIFLIMGNLNGAWEYDTVN